MFEHCVLKGGMVTARSILNEARLRKRWSMATLAEVSGVATHHTNLRKKLEEPQSSKCKRPDVVALDPIEVKKLSAALGVRIPPRVFDRDLLEGRIAICRSERPKKQGAA